MWLPEGLENTPFTTEMISTYTYPKGNKGKNKWKYIFLINSFYTSPPSHSIKELSYYGKLSLTKSYQHYAKA